jgi:hypothetical protein
MLDFEMVQYRERYGREEYLKSKHGTCRLKLETCNWWSGKLLGSQVTMIKQELRRVECRKWEMHQLTTRPRDELIKHYDRAINLTKGVHRELPGIKSIRLKLWYVRDEQRIKVKDWDVFLDLQRKKKENLINSYKIELREHVGSL